MIGVMQPDADLVDLGGIIVSADRLAREGFGVGDPSLQAAVDHLQGEPPGEQVPVSGWRVLREREDGSAVTVAAYDDDWPGWTIVEFTRDVNGWSAQRSSYGVEPRATPGVRGLGFSLAFTRPVFLAHRGQRPLVQVVLTNGSGHHWHGASGPGWVRGRLVDLRTGEHLPAEPLVAFTTPAYPFELTPGAAKELTVALLARDLTTLPPNDYGIDAWLAELDLTVKGGLLRITE
jgi:hypothetical protein